jgi:hypothetical protein
MPSSIRDEDDLLWSIHRVDFITYVLALGHTEKQFGRFFYVERFLAHMSARAAGGLVFCATKTQEVDVTLEVTYHHDP